MVLRKPPSIAVVTAIRIPNELLPSDVLAVVVVVSNNNGGWIIMITPMNTTQAKIIFQRLWWWPRRRNVKIRVNTGLEKMIARASPIGILRMAK